MSSIGATTLKFLNPCKVLPQPGSFESVFGGKVAIYNWLCKQLNI